MDLAWFFLLCVYEIVKFETFVEFDYCFCDVIEFLKMMVAEVECTEKNLTILRFYEVPSIDKDQRSHCVGVNVCVCV